jgi:hypothetical protein
MEQERDASFSPKQKKMGIKRISNTILGAGTGCLIEMNSDCPRAKLTVTEGDHKIKQSSWSAVTGNSRYK